jgi:hypothetical protein
MGMSRDWDEISAGTSEAAPPERCPVAHCRLMLATLRVQDSYGRTVTSVSCSRHGRVSITREDESGPSQTRSRA